MCLLANLNPFVKADQPVHCLRENIYGQWEFKVSKETSAVNLFESTEVCTHLRPNHVQIINKDHDFKFESFDKWKVTLDNDYKATAQICKEENACEAAINGTWSTIYD